MLTRTAAGLIAIGVLAWSFFLFTGSESRATGNGCIQCHATKQTGFGAPHSFGAESCISCHAGDSQANTEDGAHAGLIAFPGNLDNAEQACGSCHADRVASVTQNLMHTGHGIVDVTRRLIDGHAGADGTVNFQSLGHGAADSMLRKLCASCHLGQNKTVHELDSMGDRGGGCLACHINDYPADQHAPLTTNVSDARCFGCHSRSGRISLSYTGLAEILPPSSDSDTKGPRLADGRHIERMPADVHYAAGMSCIDCHTSVGLMGAAGDAGHQRGAVDIACADCHENSNAAPMRTRKEGTPLLHIQVRDDGTWLQTRNTERTLKIPTLQSDFHASDNDHDRLTCAACHSQWVPQCFGCHMEYDADGSQWDHVDKTVTPGRWKEDRWDVRNAPGPLGVNEDGRIEAFVPGMIMTVAHPDWDEDKFLRIFAPLSPHTTGPARSCESCHRSTAAVGLGEGKIIEHAGEAHFLPAHELLQDTLPKDAWTNLDGSLGGDTPLEGQRPLNADEIEAVLSAPLD